MKRKSMFTAFTLKALITCTIVGFSSFTICNAQSVVGKWKTVSIKQFFDAESARKKGMPFVEHQIPGAGKFEMEFKPDHTYVVTEGQGKDDKATGEWSVSGDQLTMKAAAQLRKGTGSQIYTFSITGNKMIRTMIVQPPYNAMFYKQEDTSIRM